MVDNKQVHISWWDSGASALATYKKRTFLFYQGIFSQYESGGTFFIGFIIEYLAKLNAIILIIYSSQPFNVVYELQEFALRGSD